MDTRNIFDNDNRIREKITWEDLSDLLRGYVVKKKWVQFFLEDIGYDIIESILVDIKKEYEERIKKE